MGFSPPLSTSCRLGGDRAFLTSAGLNCSCCPHQVSADEETPPPPQTPSSSQLQSGTRWLDQSALGRPCGSHRAATVLPESSSGHFASARAEGRQLRLNVCEKKWSSKAGEKKQQPEQKYQSKHENEMNNMINTQPHTHAHKHAYTYEVRVSVRVQSRAKRSLFRRTKRVILCS